MCTDAHFAIRHIRTPLFIRENLFDKAKLANCGLDSRGPLAADGVEYLKVCSPPSCGQVPVRAMPGPTKVTTLTRC